MGGLGVTSYNYYTYNHYNCNILLYHIPVTYIYFRANYFVKSSNSFLGWIAVLSNMFLKANLAKNLFLNVLMYDLQIKPAYI